MESQRWIPPPQWERVLELEEVATRVEQLFPPRELASAQLEQLPSAQAVPPVATAGSST